MMMAIIIVIIIFTLVIIIPFSVIKTDYITFFLNRRWRATSSWNEMTFNINKNINPH